MYDEAKDFLAILALLRLVAQTGFFLKSEIEINIKCITVKLMV